jgi:hypothetical protein
MASAPGVQAEEGQQPRFVVRTAIERLYPHLIARFEPSVGGPFVPAGTSAPPLDG